MSFCLRSDRFRRWAILSHIIRATTEQTQVLFKAVTPFLHNELIVCTEMLVFRLGDTSIRVQLQILYGFEVLVVICSEVTIRVGIEVIALKLVLI